MSKITTRPTESGPVSASLRPLPVDGDLSASDYQGPAALYLHWPFCLKKCPYCDFNSHVRDRVDQQDWARAFSRETAGFKQRFPHLKPASIFFGGGTPSLMAVETLSSILHDIDQAWGIGDNIEITMEANPSSVEAERFRGYRAAGVNRLSMGVQSLDDAALKFLGRLHSADEALEALKVARVTFDRVSIDLIYARPDYKQVPWEAELKQALAYDLSHLSLYQLTIEEGTAFYSQYQRGKFTLPDEGEAADLFDMTQQITAEAGLPAYEISNHARVGEESQHNLAYWRGDVYLGIGPGAHGRAPSAQTESAFSQAHFQVKRPEDWLAAVQKNGIGLQQAEPITRKDRMVEAVMMGLRLKRGIDRAYFKSLFGEDVTAVIDPDFCDPDYVTLTEDRLALTARGLPVLNHLLGVILRPDPSPV